MKDRKKDKVLAREIDPLDILIDKVLEKYVIVKTPYGYYMDRYDTTRFGRKMHAH